MLVEAASRAAELAAENSRLQADVRMQVAELDASRRRILASGDEEREDLERRLHEGAERLLEVLATQLGRARLMVPATTAGDRLGQTEAQLAGAREELRRLAAGLYPRILSDLGLEGALADLAERSPVPVTATVSASSLPPEVESAVYFICSEALANVAKYASASSVAVSVRAGGRRVAVAVEDDGVGGADPTGGTGLRGLADRVEALGGALHVDSVRGRGTRLVAEIPYAAERRGV